MAKPGEKKRDRALYARLVESYQADRIGIFIDFDRLNHPRSPVWDPSENIGPLLLILGGSLGVMSEIFQSHGADSLVGRMVSVMMGSGETTFYVLAVYFGSVSVSRTRQAVPAGIVADVVDHDGNSQPADQGGYLAIRRPWPGMMRTVHGALLGLNGEPVPAKAVEKQKPAVPVSRSVQHDYIVCLEDGKKLKMLKLLNKIGLDVFFVGVEV